MNNEQKALAKMNKIMMQFSFTDHVMLGAWCIIDKVVDKNQKTIGINVKSSPPYVSYNPNFICALSDEYLEAIMAKEGFKILLRHCTTRIRDPKAVSNLASDVTINNHVMNNISNFSDTSTFFTAEKLGLDKNKFYEEYHRRIKDLADDMLSKVSKIIEQTKPEESNKDEDGFETFNSQSEALNAHNDPENTTANDGWGENNLFDADVKSFVDKEQKNLKNWGKHSGNMISAVIIANTPEINPKDIVRRFNNSVMTQVSSSTRMKTNRRFDLDAPGKRQTYKARILFAVDTSGSMSEKTLSRCGALVNSVLRHAKVDYVDFDTRLYKVVKNLKHAQSEFKFEGRGGTNFQCVMDYVQEHKYDGVIVATDGGAAAPTRPTKTKVLWLLTDPDYRAPVEWGFTCSLPKEVK